MMLLIALWHRLDLWVQVWCAVLLIAFVIVLGCMLWQWTRVRARLVQAASAFEKLKMSKGDDRRLGRSVEAFERVRAVAERLGERHAEWWRQVEDAIEMYESPDGARGQFLTRSARELVSHDETTRGYAGSFFKAVPGILTSLGLLGTFVALLLGLNGLSMDASSGAVTGLNNLIENLSGKFATSIVALGLSVVFLLFEILVCQPRIRAARQRLVRALDLALPRLTSERVILDIQRETVKQSRSLANISSDVVGKFSEVFKADLAPVFAVGISTSMANQLQAEMGPMLTDLRETMSNLTTTVGRLEQNKQDSVVGEFGALTAALERSIRDALGEMGKQFQSALTGSTQEEFGQLAAIIQGSARVVEQMNSNFTVLEATLRTVVDEAKRSTTEQLTSGAEQTQRLSSLVEALMVKLNESASHNYTQMSAALTSVVNDLSDRVTQLSDELVRKVTETAEHSQSTASRTIEQASNWNAQTQKQLTDLLSTLRDKSASFDRAGDALLEAQAVLQVTLDQNHKALQALGSASSEVRTYTTGLAGIQRQVEEGQKAQVQIATLSRDAVAQLAVAAASHKEFLGEYRSTFEQYRAVFDGLDGRIGAILETILARLQQYNNAMEASFRSIIASANETMPRMAGVLKSSTDDISENLRELGDVFEKTTARLATARPE